MTLMARVRFPHLVIAILVASSIEALASNEPKQTDAPAQVYSQPLQTLQTENQNENSSRADVQQQHFSPDPSSLAHSLPATVSSVATASIQDFPTPSHEPSGEDATTAVASEATTPNQTTTTTSTTTTTTSTTPIPATVSKAVGENRSEATSQPSSQQSNSSPSSLPQCTLGDDTYQIGERWNPNLPPFGVQVCVLCECIARQRKSCYEAKVTCRRITNECPKIDSCPDGKPPVTVAGQCCKSCQSSTSAPLQQQHQPDLFMGDQSPSYESQPLLKQPPATSISIVYMNERSKSYMSLIKDLPACQTAQSDSTTKSASTASTTPTPSQMPKTAKGTRNDLNGIDTRMAFKSLQDSASSHASSSRLSNSTYGRHRHHETATAKSFESSSDQQQHPNDVQSATASNRLDARQSAGSAHGMSGSNSAARQALASSCTLGNETFQMGDVWNPFLHPFGVQVCVQCNCIFKLQSRRNCFETRVTCRRINKDCPVIESCPDGNLPINVDGQCCKTCPDSLERNVEQEQRPAGNPMPFQPTTMPLNGIMRDEKIYKDFYTQTKNLHLCGAQKEVGTSRYARRAKRGRRARRH